VGYIEARHLKALGQALKMKKPDVNWAWKDLNQSAMSQIDKNGNGRASALDFATHLESMLPQSPDAFRKSVVLLIDAAKDAKGVIDMRKPQGGARRTSVDQTPSADALKRLAKLEEVHTAMDVDESGYIEAPELMLLGIARRTLGQKEEWTKEMNQRMVDRMDINLDGKIGPKEFAKYFERVLPIDAAEFAKTMKEFLAVAAEVKNGPKPTPPKPDLATTRSRAGSGAKFEIRGSKPLPLAAKKKDLNDGLAQARAARNKSISKPKAFKEDALDSAAWDRKLKQADQAAAAARASTAARKKQLRDGLSENKMEGRLHLL
jgi:Ca2+-binding EF-hand superfamily protein